MKKHIKLVSSIVLAFYSTFFSYVGSSCPSMINDQPYYITDRLEYSVERDEYVLYMRLYNASDRSLFFTARTLLGKNSKIEWFDNDWRAVPLRALSTVGQPRGNMEIKPNSYIERGLTLQHKFPDLSEVLKKQSLLFTWVASVRFHSGEGSCGVGTVIPECYWKDYIAKGKRVLPQQGQGVNQAEERSEIMAAIGK